MQLRNARLHVREEVRFSDGSRLFSFCLGLSQDRPSSLEGGQIAGQNVFKAVTATTPPSKRRQT